MSTESLIIELDAQTKKMDAKIKSATKRLDELDGGVKKADSSLLKFGKVAGVAGQVLVKTAASALALSAAVTAMVVSSAKGRRELELLSTQAKTSVDDFQSLSFATGQFGINAEQIADISKDVSDKVGEFARDATGPFQDFANQMKLTKNQAKDLAIEFQDLSSEQVIGRMVSMMEEAGASGDQMTQVLESMGNDLSRLKPLFADNAAELKKLKDGFNEINKSLQITDLQAEKLQKVSKSYDLMTASIGNATTAVSATLAPVMDDFFNDVIEIVPVATQAIINFLNSFQDPENINKENDVLEQIKASKEEIIKLQDAYDRVSQIRIESANALNVLTTTDERNQAAAFEVEVKRLKGLEDQLLVLKKIREEKDIADAEILTGGQIGGETGDGVSTGTGDLQSKELEAIKNRFKTEEELLLNKFDLEQELINREVESKVERDELLLALAVETGDKLLAIKDNQLSKEQKIKDKEQKKQGKLNKILDKQAKDDAARDDKLARDGMALASIVFEDNKAVASGIALVNTAQGITEALSTQDYAGAALTAVMGATQIAAINSASKGGGSTPSVSSSAPSSTPQQDNFTPETSSLELSESGEGSAQTINVVFSTDDGSDFFDMVGQSIAENNRQGR